MDEFSRKARLLKPLSTALSDKFTRGVTADVPDDKNEVIIPNNVKILSIYFYASRMMKMHQKLLRLDCLVS